jgi:hypothetical protein
VPRRRAIPSIQATDPQLPLVQLPSGAWRQRAPSPADFQLGQVISEGTIQRYISAMHPDFADDHRIAGDYMLVNLPIAEVPESEWEISDEKAAAYAAMLTPLPPVVLDRNLSFVDGGHRHVAAQLRGASHLAAFVPVAIVAKYFPSAP